MSKKSHVNQVVIAGRVVKAAALGGKNDALEVLLENEHKYTSGGKDGSKTFSHRVVLVGELAMALSNALEQRSNKKDPLYVVLEGRLSESSYGEGDNKKSYTYILGNKLIYACSNPPEAQTSFAVVEGEVMFRDFKYLPSGTPKVQLLVRSQRAGKEKSISAGVGVSLFMEDEEVPVQKGDSVLVLGRLESYEKEPGIFTTSVVSFGDFFKVPALNKPENPKKVSESESVVGEEILSLDTSLPKGVSVSLEDNDLPF